MRDIEVIHKDKSSDELYDVIASEFKNQQPTNTNSYFTVAVAKESRITVVETVQ